MQPVLSGKHILVTGGAGFIGGHLAASLAGANDVRVLDNLSTGHRANLPQNAQFEEGDLRNPDQVDQAVRGCDVVFHEGALCSVARSVEDPRASFEANVLGTFNVLEAARRHDVGAVVFAASSSAYGDTPTLPKHEEMAPRPQSPYAAFKIAGEALLASYARSYGLRAHSLRYFNVYGPRQDPKSQYAAVIPKFIESALAGRALPIHGDGRQTRDFTYVDDVVRANVLAATRPGDGSAVNIAGGMRVSLLDLVARLEAILGRTLQLRHEPARVGDVRDSLADLGRARQLLGWAPSVTLDEGLRRTVDSLRATATRSAQA